MQKSLLTLLFFSTCLLLQAQDLIQTIQSGIVPSSTNPESTFSQTLKLNRVQTKAQIPFEFLRTAPEDKGQVFLDLKPTILNKILLEKNNYINLEIPVDDQHLLEIEFFKKDVLSADFVVKTSQGIVDDTFLKKSVFYHGMVKGHEESWATLSVFENEMTVFIHDNKGDYTIGKISNSDNYILYNESKVVPDIPTLCGFDDDSVIVQTPKIKTDQQKSSRSMDCPVRVYIENDFETYNNFSGNTTDITTRMTGTFNQVVALYASISIGMEMSELFIWDTDDNYGDGNTGDFGVAFSMLNTFNSAMTSSGFDGELAHLVTMKPPGTFGSILGVASLGQVCGFAPTGYSQIFAFYSDFPTYSPSVSLFAHELGHNMDSPHTHACAWNGNNTAIDNCVGTEGNCSSANNGQAAGYVGTTMSYCGTKSLSFDPQVTTRMQAHYAAAQSNCLSTCGPGPCTDTEVDIELQLDQNPTETSWQLFDGDGNLVSSGGSYTTQFDVVSATECLTNGCYDLVINDTQNNGICCGFGLGYVTVLDNASGIAYASGGEFTSQQTISFCVPYSCSTNSTLNGALGSAIHQADNNITSDAIVLTNETVDFLAGNSIDLISDFEVALGADFQAYIAPCTSTLNSEENNLSSSTSTIQSSKKEDKFSVLVNARSGNLEVILNKKQIENTKLEIYNQQGQLVDYSLINSYKHNGIHLMELDYDALDGGLYLFVLKTEKEQYSKKVVIPK